MRRCPGRSPSRIKTFVARPELTLGFREPIPPRRAPPTVKKLSALFVGARRARPHGTGPKGVGDT
eukprot:6526879-Prymnesium_polylepis.1